MLKVVDIWEADNYLEVPTLLNAGVMGAIVRLNDMNGGHHLDELFPVNWERAKQFAVQSVYFVYNPWVDGKTNADWFLSHLPSDIAHRRLFADVEVKYAGYSPDTYASEVAKFKDLIEKKFPYSAYTGQWFLNYLSKWPTGSYWWARYPDVFWPEPPQTITWAEFDRRGAAMKFKDADPDKSCPGTVELWQCSGDKLFLPGLNGRAIDVNYFDGTVDQLKAFFGVAATVPEPEETPVGMYTQYPKGIYLINQTVTDASKIKGDFVVGYMGSGLNKNPKFTDHIQTAADAQKPFIAFYENDPEEYAFQYGSLNPDRWGKDRTNNLIKGLVDQQLMSGSKMRTVHGIILSMNKIKFSTANVDVTPGWLVETARHMAATIWNLYGIPTWFYMDAETCKLLPTGTKDELTTFLSHQGFVGDPAHVDGISTFFDAFSGTPFQAAWNPLPTPPDSMAAPLSNLVRESGLGNAPRTQFLCYSTGDFTFDGITGITPLFTYFGTAAGLNEKLKFTPGVTTPPVVIDPPVIVPPVIIPGDATVITLLTQIRDELRRTRTIS
jgi:GH25 family lysozyme M1 (1,4-beta-N-acetylmuramidase)